MKQTKRKQKTVADRASRQDVYERVTSKIVADLENGVRTWMKPWNADHAAGRITRPLRANGKAYKGIDIVMLWASAVEQGAVDLLCCLCRKPSGALGFGAVGIDCVGQLFYKNKSILIG